MRRPELYWAALRHPSAPSPIASVVLLLLLAAAGPACAQQFAPLHVTLAAWDDDIWLDLLDRNYSVGGRHSDQGILKQWYDIDPKYHLDLYFLEPNLPDEYEWTRETNGVRWFGGSLTPRDLAVSGEFKVSVGLGKRWRLASRFDLVSVPRVRRGAFRANLEYDVLEDLEVAFRVHLDPQKPGTDMGLSGKWRTGMGPVQVEFWSIDIFNNLVYVNLDAAGQAQIDLTEEYETRPWGLKAFFDLEPVDRLRIEGYGGRVTPSTIHVYDPLDPNAGFVGDEQTWYAGGLLEFTINKRLLIAGFATNWSAESSKAWDVDAPDEQDYFLEERVSRAGAALIYRPRSRWEVELGGERNWRPETRLDPANGDTLVSYRLDTWLARLNVRYQSKKGFYSDVRFGFNENREPLGSGQVPTALPLAATTYRIGVEIGWRIGRHVMLGGGAARDIGADPQGTGFGGARGRGTVTW